jgi:glycosyltransferase involved in cell wall biosynthesis
VNSAGSRRPSTINADEITVVVLTRNEERNLERALRSLPEGVRALVVDAHSSDRTVEIARTAGARVVSRLWTGFVSARRFALSQVTTPWTLMLDADEEIDGELGAAILHSDGDADGYEVLRTTYFGDKPLRIWSNEPLLRLFKTASASVEARPAAGGAAELHERWRVAGRVRRLAGTLRHYSYADRRAYREKYARYTNLEAQGVHANLAVVAAQAATGVARFVRLLVLKGAVLDGATGAYVAWASAFYPAVVAYKAWRR